MRLLLVVGPLPMLGYLVQIGAIDLLTALALSLLALCCAKDRRTVPRYERL